MKSNTDIRTAALNWWANQSEAFKALQFTQYKKETFTPANFHTELTGREIEAIFTDLGLSERAIKESTHITWWKGLNEEEQTKLCQKHFQGIPVESLMERSIKVMYHYENPQLPDYLVWWNGLKGSQQNAMIDKYPELFGTKNTENKMEKYMYAAEQKERVMKIFIDKYKDSQMYDGMIPANSSLIDFIGDFDIIASLVMEGKLERRNCEGSAYQLSKEEREKVFSAENPLTTETTTNTVTGSEWYVEYGLDQCAFIKSGEDTFIASIESEDGKGITPEMEANANRIVNCVNNFDSLVSALKRIEKEGVKVLEEWTKGKEIDFKTICGAMVEVAQSVLNFKP